MHLVQKNDIIEALSRVYDPEIPVNIYELGLIYEIDLDNQEDGAIVDILITLTNPNCPEAERLPVMIKNEVMSVEGVKKANVNITFEPPWTEDKMSVSAKLALDMLFLL